MSEIIDRITSLLHSTMVFGTEADAISVPNSSRLVCLERLRDRPELMRARFRTESLESFVGYVQENVADQCPAVFVDPDGPKAKAIIDYGSPTKPQWGEHLAVVELTRTPLAAALAAATLTPQTQDALIDLIDDWGEHLTFWRGDEIVPTHDARRRFADMTIEQVRQSRSNRQSFERERSTAERLTMGNLVPDAITVNAEYLRGLGTIEQRFALRAVEAGSLPAVSVRQIGEGAMHEKLSQRLCERLRAELEGIPVYEGESAVYAPPALLGGD